MISGVEQAGSTLAAMDVVATLVAPCPPEELFAWVDDLGRYPDWLEIVARAEPDGDDAWAVDLRGRLGPLARSKRLRMVRSTQAGSASEPDTPLEARSGSAPVMSVRFKRAELDGRNHSPWVLEADVTAHGNGSELHMRLHYGGGLFGPVIERLLRDEIERSRLRLLALVSEPGGP